MTLGNDNGTDGQTDGQTDRVRRNMRPPPREEGRIIRPRPFMAKSFRCSKDKSLTLRPKPVAVRQGCQLNS